MGMRKKEILSENGVRVYQKQSFSFGQKMAIAGSAVLVIAMLIGGFFALRWKNAREEAERLASVPEEPDYINQIGTLLPTIHSFTFSGSISGFPLPELLPAAAKVMTANYVEYYIDGMVNTNETQIRLYGMTEEGGREYLTTFIYNDDGGYMDVAEYYKYYPDLLEIQDVHGVYLANMEQAANIDIPNSDFTDRDYFMSFLNLVMQNIRASRDTKYATDTSKENSYSVQFSPSVFNGKYENTVIAKMFLSSAEPVLSSVVYNGDKGKHEISIAFQQGESVCSLILNESTEKYDNTMVYSVSQDVLNAALDTMQAMYMDTQKPEEK